MPRTKKQTSKPATKSEVKDRLRALEKTTQGFKLWKPAGEVLTRVRAHPTIFPLVDRATGVDGWPIQRVSLVHGPSNHGKTLLTHGLGLSFLRAANFFAFIDAEFTTPIEWLSMLMAGYETHPGFIAKRPDTYEDTVKAVREFAENVSKARDRGDLPADTSGLIVVDSIRKLVPKNLLDKMLKGNAGMDGASGRGAMMKAALNAQWLDELVPLLYHSNLGMVFISREYEKGEEKKKKGMNLQDPSLGVDFKVGGGKSLAFDSSLTTRVTRSWLREGTDEHARIIGEKHRVTITKTKIAGKDDKTAVGFFHTSNGKLTPEGFDRARDVFTLAKDAGVLKQNGSWFTWPDGNVKWQGENKAVQALAADEGLLDSLEGEAR